MAGGLPESGDSPLARRDVLLGMIQKEFPSYHPLLSIARIAHSDEADLKLQFECHKTIAKYVEPEIKSIEVKGELGHRHKVQVSLFEPVDANFSPVNSVLEGSATRVALDSPARELPSGGTLDLEPVVIDRVVGEW